MSNSAEEYSRRDRLSYRQNHQIAGAASATDRYHIPSYDASSARHLSVYEPFTDSRRPPPPASYDGADNQERHSHSTSYELSDKYHLHNSYDLADHRLPPLPPSPNHYVLNSEEPFIPPPDCYLSPPAPAPPDRFQPSSTSHDRFLLSSNDLYSPSASSIDKYKTSNSDRMQERYMTDKYSTCSSPENQLDRHIDRYGAAYSGGPGDPFVRQDPGYHNHYRLLNSNYYHQKPNISSQRYVSSGMRAALHNQYQTLRIQKCCNTSYHPRDAPQTRDPSPGTQSRIRTSRTSSPVSMVPSAAAATIPVDFLGSSSNSGRYLTPYSSTLPRCNSYGDVQCNPSNIGTFRRTPLAHENCCFKRRTSSPSATCSYPSHPLNYSTSTTTTSASSSVSSINSQSFHQPSLPQLSSTWKPIPVNTPNSAGNLQNNLSTAPQISSNISNNNSGSNVNSPSLSFSSSRSSPSLTTISTTNTTASATTSPTAISTNSGSSSAVMDNHGQHGQWQGVASNSTDVEETGSPATEIAEDSLSSTNESLNSPPHQGHVSAPPMGLSHHRNPPASLPVQSSFDKPVVKHPLQHQISAPVTATEVASSRRYSRSISKKELIKNYIKKETAVFFGVHEPTEENERVRWLDRTKRLAYRTYGKLKNEYQLSSACSTLQKPDVLPLASQRTSTSVITTDERDAAEPRSIESTLKRKPSVAKMTFEGVAYVVSTLGKHKRRPSSTSRQWSRSYAPSSVPPTPSSPLDDEVFFDGSPPTVSVDEYSHRSATSAVPLASAPMYQASSTTISNVDQVDHDSNAQHRYMASSHRMRKEKYYTWRRPKERIEEDQVQIGLSRIWGRILDRVFDNSDRRQYGIGIVGKVFGRSLKRSVMNREPVKEQLEDLEDHRPFFTYWVTTVQILILALSIFAYGLGPVGFDLTQRSGLVLVTSLSLQQVEYSEPSNFWVGPRAADLIHMGAKFAPCMRKDKKIIKEIEKMRDRERDTACCIRNDDSGCVQASQAECSQTISTWKKLSDKSGTVCGLDPKFCEAPASVAPYEWPDDITKWPICRKMNSRFPVQTSPYDQQRFQKDKMTAEHMVCEVIGHPCCIGIHGTCRITTKEYCDFVRGYFHEDASLCSQVSCLDDVCGMIPFYFPEVPDQFYRLWTSLFIHAGILHLMVTVFIQYFLMRDLEKLTGSLRIALIYIGSGVAGNLASAIFVPYRADVGPAGAQFGLLACLIVEVLNCWPMLKYPFQALFKLLTITFMLFLFGLLPWVDNFAHLFGFIFGFLLSYALLPFVSFGRYDRQKKIFLIWVCLLSSLFLFILLVLLFYLIPIYDCEFCQYFNCIPLTRDFCASQNINFKREEYIV